MFVFRIFFLGSLFNSVVSLFSHTTENKRYAEQWALLTATMLLSLVLVQIAIDTEGTVICSNSLLCFTKIFELFILV
jgi:hypothetical protein